MRLLLVEDDAMIGESIAQGVRREFFVVDWVRDGKAAELALAADRYALVLLDLGLPRKSGLELLRATRRRGLRVTACRWSRSRWGSSASPRSSPASTGCGAARSRTNGSHCVRCCRSATTCAARGCRC